MSATRKVCLWHEAYGADEVFALCGHVWFAVDGPTCHAWPLAAWVNLPSILQCQACANAASSPLSWEPVNGTANRRSIRAQIEAIGRIHASRSHILSVSLLCVGLHGSLDVTLRALLAQHIAGDDSADNIALDLAEQHGYDTPGMLPVASVQWPIIEQHEHTWMPWRSGEIVRARRRMGQPRMVRRCPCWMFEHEVQLAEHEARMASYRADAMFVDDPHAPT